VRRGRQHPRRRSLIREKSAKSRGPSPAPAAGALPQPQRLVGHSELY
jgi:hypothetical protein